MGGEEPLIRIEIHGLDPAVKGAATLEAMAHMMSEALQVTERKNVGYGDAWRQQGWMGNTARILSKASRLKNMVWQDYEFGDGVETVDETVRDMMNLCVFFLMNRGQENKWGR